MPIFWEGRIDAMCRESEANAHPIRFDEWLRRVFDHDVADDSWWCKEGTDWNDLPPLVSLEYLSRLFGDANRLLRAYTDAQVNQGLWLLIDCGRSDHLRALENPEVEWPIRLRCVRSIIRLFEMFATRCSTHLSHLDEPGANPLNSICYMFWDIFPVSAGPEESACSDLDHSLLAVMTEILTLPSDACRESALHGLGHWHASHPDYVEKAVDLFIASNLGIRAELRQYAERARIGYVL